jgi:phospholipid/cholesterol/gamma-HCH transport system permease protein
MAKSTGPGGRGWDVAVTGNRAVVSLSGDWIARTDPFVANAAPRILSNGVRALAYDAGGLGRWDSALILFLSALRVSAGQQIAIDETGLPSSARQLLAMTGPSPAPVRRPNLGLLDGVGTWAIALILDVREIVSMIGTLCLRSLAIVARRSSLRGGDLVEEMVSAGAAALPIVTLVNVLVGAILAFVGAIQLRRFGADIYVAGPSTSLFFTGAAEAYLEPVPSPAAD